MLHRAKAALGERLARYLEKQTDDYVHFAVTPLAEMRATLRPGDVLLVEGNSRISSAIKYLTHSTWSHAALYVGGPPEAELVEADLRAGVRAVSIAGYAGLNVRICRPARLRPDDLHHLINFARDSIGRTYDLRNFFDLARYLLPLPPVSRRWHRRMLALGSGDPTRAICSTLIAEAFEHVRYPILPEIHKEMHDAQVREIMHIRHWSLFVPRDFDLSPYFRIVKPTLGPSFDYRALEWSDRDVSPATPASDPS